MLMRYQAALRSDSAGLADGIDHSQPPRAVQVAAQFIFWVACRARRGFPGVHAAPPPGRFAKPAWRGEMGSAGRRPVRAETTSAAGRPRVLLAARARAAAF